MNEELATVYTQAAKVCGKHSSCDNKTKLLNYTVESYLCSFCKTWHFVDNHSLNDLKTLFIIANVYSIG